MDVNNKCKWCRGCFYFRHDIQRCGRRQYMCTLHFPLKGRLNGKKFKYKSIW